MYLVLELNVLTIFTDRKTAGTNGVTNTITGYNAVLIASQDYYPFGMQMDSRGTNAISGSTQYRFGFNGQEKDNEIYGDGNATTALFWEYDARIGRRWNLDPKANTWESYYAVMGDNPIQHSDILGDKWGDKKSEQKGNSVKKNAELKRNKFKSDAEKYKNLAEEARKGESSMTQMISDLEKMGDENNPTEFFFEKIEGETGYTSMNDQGQVIMEYSTESNLSHEITHGGQHLRGEVEFVKGKKIRYYDLTDEKNAYNTQYFYGGKNMMPFKVENSKDITIDIIKTMPEYEKYKERTQPVNKPIQPLQ